MVTNDKTATPTDLSGNAVEEISSNLRRLLADVFALYVKTKNFHWHMSGQHFRDYHLLLDEQATQILATTDIIAERVRKLGGQTINSIGHIGRLEQIHDNNADAVAPREMLTELLEDNRLVTKQMRKMHALCDERGGVMSASLIENRIDGAEGCAWFPLEDINSSK